MDTPHISIDILADRAVLHGSVTGTCIVIVLVTTSSAFLGSIHGCVGL